MDEKEYEGGGVTVGYVFRVIMSRKWLALIVALAITLAGTLGLYFGYGASKREYTLSFALNLPGMDSESTRCSYPDGTYFYFDDYTSLDVLRAVKNGNEDFGYINVEQLVKKDAIGITDKESTEERRVFTLSVKKGYLRNENSAKEFLSALAEYPVNLYNEIDVNYNIYLDEYSFSAATTYEEQLEYLVKQINYLDKFYDAFSTQTDDNGIFVENYKHKFDAWCTRKGFDFVTTEVPGELKSEVKVEIKAESLEVEANANYYLKDYETIIASYRNKIVVLERNLSDAEKVLEETKNNLGNYQLADGASVLAQLQDRVTSIQSEINNLNGYIEAYYPNGVLDEEHVAAGEAFGQKISGIFSELVSESGFIAECASLSKTVYAKLASVTYQSELVVRGGMGIVMSFVVSLIAGLIVAAITAYSVGVKRIKNPAPKKEQTSEKDID